MLFIVKLLDGQLQVLRLSKYKQFYTRFKTKFIINFSNRRWGTDEEFVLGPQPSDDRINLENTMEKERGETTGVLRFSRMIRPDDGLYECIASNKGGKAYKTGHITIEYPPTFDHMKGLPPVYSWNEREANLSCLAEGFPNATIEWRRDERLITELADSNLRIEGTGPRSDLLVKPASQSYYRAYRCIASNRLGRTEHLMQLREAKIPESVVQALARSVTATAITFDIVGPPSEIGLPILSYHCQYKDERDRDWEHAQNITWSPDSPYVVQGLRPETSYTFR